MILMPPPIDTIKLERLFCDWPAWIGTVDVALLLDVLLKVHKNKGQLMTLWGSDERLTHSKFQLHLLFLFPQHCTLYLHCDLSENNPAYPDLSPYFPVADRLQRALFDLFGFKAIHSVDQRPWLRHGSWPADIFPLRDEVKIDYQFYQEQDYYPFIQVKGEGVHEIPVGPVHAGTIEPGHFRFQVVGERILRLEERFGYTHKGIAKHFQQASFEKGAQLAGRICGDSTVAYAWSYSMALENLHGHLPPPRAQWLRALLLERERIMNHLGDLGSLGNDAGFRFGLNQFSRLKELVLRLNSKLFNHRYLMDSIVPGGVTIDLSSEDANYLIDEIHMLHQEVKTIESIYQEHDGLQDRFLTTGVIGLDLAVQLGLLGLTARASGVQNDWRKDLPYPPYNKLNVKSQIKSSGDVAARVAIRFQEIEASLCLIKAIVTSLPKGKIISKLPAVPSHNIGLGCVEGWRGPITTILCNSDNKHLCWGQIHDPSWQNWPALEHAVIGNIVPDFPLINKSFNLSYSGHDV
ncbi:MAG: NADH-quinone oxidoreductase subunit C [Tatlockia sp.]|jgi:Ni,Fe-hydrogenase III large subunit/Ni,Fe-hydrogenase III component G